MMKLMLMPVLRRLTFPGLLLWTLALLVGCSTNPNPDGRYIFSTSQPAVAYGGTNAPDANQFSLLRVGDLIIINFSDTKEPMPKLELSIPDSGIITLPFNVHIKADGKTTTQLEREIREAYVPNLFVNLTVAVRVESRVFYVDGEVRQPKSYSYIGETTVLRAIANAGGFTEFANKKKIELRRQNGQRFFVNYYKALRDPRMDIPVYPNDHIIVDRSLF